MISTGPVLKHGPSNVSCLQVVRYEKTQEGALKRDIVYNKGGCLWRYAIDDCRSDQG